MSVKFDNYRHLNNILVKNTDISVDDLNTYKCVEQISPTFSNGSAFFKLLDERGKNKNYCELESKLNGSTPILDTSIDTILSLRDANLNFPNVHGTFNIGFVLTDDFDDDDFDGAFDDKVMLDSINNRLLSLNQSPHFNLNEQIEPIKWLLESGILEGIHSDNINNNLNITDIKSIDEDVYNKYKDDIKFTNGNYNDTMKRYFAGRIKDGEMNDLYKEKKITKNTLKENNIQTNGRYLMGLKNSLITRNQDGSIDYNGDIHITNDIHNFVPNTLNFNKVNGNFIVDELNESNINFMPKLVNGDFKIKKGNCKLNNFNKLPKVVNGNCEIRNCESASLMGIPKVIGNKLILHNISKLKSLDGYPTKIGSDVSISGCNDLESLQGMLRTVNGNLSLNNNKNLKSLKNCSIRVQGNFESKNCCLDNIEDICQVINGRYIDISNNKIKSLKGIPNDFNKIVICDDNDITDLAGCCESQIDSLYIKGNPLIDVSKYPSSLSFIKATENKQLNFKNMKKVLTILCD